MISSKERGKKLKLVVLVGTSGCWATLARPTTAIETLPHFPLLMFTNNPGEIVDKKARSAGISAVIYKSDSDSLKQLLARAKALLGLDGAAI